MSLEEIFSIKNIIIYLIIINLIAFLAMWLDKRPIKPMIKGLLCYPLFMGSWLLINFKCLFKRNTSWEKINHVRSIKINEINNIEEDLKTEKELI